MKNLRWMGWIVVAMLVLPALPATAAGTFGTFYKHNCSGTKGSWNYRRAGSLLKGTYVDVPANAAKITVETGTDSHGGFGTCFLYVRYGNWPTATSPDTGVSRFSGFRQRAEQLNPPAGRYYIRLYAQSNYRTCIKIIVTSKPTIEWRTDMLNKVNYERGRRSIPRLTINSQLQAAAQAYATDMASKCYYGGDGHLGSTAANRTPEIRVRNSGYFSGYMTYGSRENIAIGQTTVQSVMYGPGWCWMTSSGHQANILNPNMTHVGFGYSKNNNDTYYVPGSSLPAKTRWVQVFGYRR